MFTVGRKRILLAFGVVLAVASMSINVDELQPKAFNRVATELMNKTTDSVTGQWIGKKLQQSVQESD